MKYIDSEKLIAEIEFAKSVYSNPNRVVHGIADAFRQDGRAAMCDDILKKIASLQQEQPKGNLEYWLEHFGMPKENIDNCITQIAQGYGACRYLEGIQHGAEAVNEIAKQEQPQVDLDALVNEAFDKYSSVDGYGQLSASFNRAELYWFIKEIARKEGAK